MRTATIGIRLPPRYSGRYFNPRGPCGPRPSSRRSRILGFVFQSSRSLRTATSAEQARIQREWQISILAVLADRDGTRFPPRYSGRYFNPRGPCGPRLRKMPNVKRLLILDFNPRGPCGPRRPPKYFERLFENISILAVLADRDCPYLYEICSAHDFNPRGPCGPRHLNQ